MAQNNFVVSPRLEAFMLEVSNKDLISHEIFPDVYVGARTFVHDYRPIGEAFTAPQNRISSRGNIPYLGSTAGQRMHTVSEYGFRHSVTEQELQDSENQRQDNRSLYDPKVTTTRRLTEGMNLRKEIRSAAKVADPANYYASRVVDPIDYWSNPGSDPIDQIVKAQQSAVVPLDALILGDITLDFLLSHPRIVEAVRGTGAGVGAIGRVSEEQLASTLRVKRILKGAGRVNANNQFDPELAAAAGTTTLNRIWGNFASLAHLNPDVRSVSGDSITWGLTANYIDRQVSEYFDRNVGAYGAHEIKVVESLDEIVMAPIAGFLFQGVHNEPGAININEMNAIAGRPYVGV